jgi:subtilisin family serine protease
VRALTAIAFGALALVAAVSPARAELDARLIARAAAGSSIPRAFSAPDGLLSLLVELPDGVDAKSQGLTAAAPGFAALRLPPAELESWASAHPAVRIWWSPPRRPLMDRADDWTQSAQFRMLTDLRGAGVIVGIVDTGFDPTHPDLLDAEGKSRARWVIDFSKTARGLHPELEAEYGCTSTASPCAILSGSDVDQLVASGSPLAPRDAFGHGTHVASLAAGDGSAQDPPIFVGTAPEATLIIARVTRSDGGDIYDADILTATRFVFERARALGMPAVVNLSLGSDFGAHDGSSPLERGLSAFVGAAQPGRALVVAAGNSGGVYQGFARGYPEPLGIHTEVHVPRGSNVRVPLLSPPTSGPATRGTIYVWIAARPGDALSVGVDDAEGEWIEPLPPGTGATYRKGNLEATIINDRHGESSPLPAGSQGAVVVLDGSWKSGTSFALRLAGRGTARLYVQSEGDLASTVGALFPRARKQGTIGIPASSPGLIAVGATINRLGWTDRQGNQIRVDSFGSVENPKLDSSAYFSGAGPTSDARMKPDLVAPGAFVVGAMSALAAPDLAGENGMFAGARICAQSPGCLVVDDAHAISTGTSMAAPLVAGAIALLLERDPTLSQPQISMLLQAGARRPEGDVPIEQQVGPGALDLVGTLQVLDLLTSPSYAEPDRAESWIALASSYAHPDPAWPLAGVVQLRTPTEAIADVDPARLRLEAEPARMVAPLQRVAPGMWSFSLAAPAGSGLGVLSIRLLLDGQPLLERQVPIATDPWTTGDGLEARGGCVIGRGASSNATALVLVVAACILRRRRRALAA